MVEDRVVHEVHTHLITCNLKKPHTPDKVLELPNNYYL